MLFRSFFSINLIAKIIEKNSQINKIRSNGNNNLAKDILFRSRSKDHTQSVEFLKSKTLGSQQSALDVKLNAKKFDIIQKKNYDRLGGLINKFSSIITENQKDFKSKYQEKIKGSSTSRFYQSVIFKNNN